MGSWLMGNGVSGVGSKVLDLWVGPREVVGHRPIHPRKRRRARSALNWRVLFYFSIDFCPFSAFSFSDCSSTAGWVQAEFVGSSQHHQTRETWRRGQTNRQPFIQIHHSESKWTAGMHNPPPWGTSHDYFYICNGQSFFVPYKILTHH